jgi:hypothetical protein
LPRINGKLSGDIENAIQHVRILLAPTQQPPRESARIALEAAVQAWDESDAEIAKNTSQSRLI